MNIINILKYIFYLCIITILFIIYSEYSVGSILFRPDSYGNIYMNFGSMINFMMNPFYKSDLWNFATLDINYAFIIIISVIIILYDLFRKDN